jgi:uncharacterized RDD family membrane protein YckC
MLYDLLILAALWLLTGFIYLLIVGVNEQRDAQTLQLTLLPLLLIVTGAFYTWFWRHGGQTLGMRAWRLIVIDGRTLSGTPPTLTQCLIRFLSACLSLASLGLGYGWVLIDPAKATWHDHLSETRTLVISREENRLRHFNRQNT